VRVPYCPALALSFLAQAAHTQGVVVGLRSNNSTTYAPVVHFMHGATQIEFSTSMASNPPSYHTGKPNVRDAAVHWVMGGGDDDNDGEAATGGPGD